MKKEVSILIPTFMEEKYIEKTLKSVKNQTFKNFEIIVVDSNSIDKTREIAKKYARVYNIKKRGIALARNFAVKKAKAPLILFLDADTILEKRFLKKAIKHFKNSSVISLIPYMKSIDNSNKLFSFIGNRLVILSLKIGFPMFPTTCVVYKKAIFSKISFNEKYITSEDLDFSLRARKLGKMIFDPTIIAMTSTRRIKQPEYSIFWLLNLIKLFLKIPSKKYSTIRLF